jgi:hypothetical protein
MELWHNITKGVLKESDLGVFMECYETGDLVCMNLAGKKDLVIFNARALWAAYEHHQDYLENYLNTVPHSVNDSIDTYDDYDGEIKQQR